MIKKFSVFGTGLSCSFLLSHLALVSPEIRVLLICGYLAGIGGAITFYLLSDSEQNSNPEPLIVAVIALLMGVFYALGLGQAWIALRLLLWVLLLIITVAAWVFFGLPKQEEEHEST